VPADDGSSQFCTETDNVVSKQFFVNIRFSQLANSFGRLYTQIVCPHGYTVSMESLILAQDERWRRA
jgi:hypothetical protein